MPHWHLASLGGAEGTALLDEREVRVTFGSSRRFEVGRTLEIDADSGKFADSEDGFIFCYRMVDPSAENFRISATVTATKSAAGADQQSGCGIMRCIIHDPVTVSCHATSSCKKIVTMGLPCTSTHCTGSDELIDDGESGLPVPLRDEDALAEAMERLADDSELRAGLSEAARLRTLEFALEDVIRAWERIL